MLAVSFEKRLVSSVFQQILQEKNFPLKFLFNQD
jgi:hypothetical protein